jgi:hypothetical protein
LNIGAADATIAIRKGANRQEINLIFKSKSPYSWLYMAKANNKHIVNRLQILDAINKDLTYPNIISVNPFASPEHLKIPHPLCIVEGRVHTLPSEAVKRE